MRDRVAHVDGWPINISTLQHAVAQISDAAQAEESFCCFTLNLDHLVKLRSDAEFRRAYTGVRFITADGEPVAHIARRQWHTVRRTTGADMLEPICAQAAVRGIPVFLFGSSIEVLQVVAARLERQSAGKLRIVGCEAPPNGFDPASDAARECLERIEKSGARLCFVMLGAPKQELLSARAMELNIKCGFICCGAAGDFLAGRQKRAPQIMQKTGAEWLWRLAHNPLRLGMRYFRCLLLYLRLEAVLATRRATAGLRPTKS